jgi:hypothetical protein
MSVLRVLIIIAIIISIINDYDLVDKYDEKIELIKRQGNETGIIAK